MTAKRFYDWQTAGGTDDVMRLVNCLERADIPWCAIGGVAVNHWAEETMVKAVTLLEAEGFASSRFEWSVNFRGASKVSLQLSTEEFYREFASRAVPADVHGILLRVASLRDTLAGKIKAWNTTERRQSKRIKDLGDISRLVESHPELWSDLPSDLQAQIERPV
jgi:hypothetical protein